MWREQPKRPHEATGVPFRQQERACMTGRAGVAPRSLRIGPAIGGREEREKHARMSCQPHPVEDRRSSSAGDARSSVPRQSRRPDPLGGHRRWPQQRRLAGPVGADEANTSFTHVKDTRRAYRCSAHRPASRPALAVICPSPLLEQSAGGRRRSFVTFIMLTVRRRGPCILQHDITHRGSIVLTHAFRAKP